MAWNKAKIRMEMDWNISEIREVLSALKEIESPREMVIPYSGICINIIFISPSQTSLPLKEEIYKTLAKNQKMAVLKEKEAFLKMEKELMPEYSGKFVAVLQGEVIEVGEDESELALRIYKKYGYVPMYIGQVGVKERVIRVPSPKIRKR